MGSLSNRNFTSARHNGRAQNGHQSHPLDDDVKRIASTLASLSQELSAAVCALNSAKTNAPPMQAEAVRRAIRTRRLRSRYFTTDLFADPAWDMMLELLLSEMMHFSLSVSDLCAAAGVPATTALRWQTLMVEKGFFVRRPDPLDARRVFVELAPETSRALRCYFADVEAETNQEQSSISS